MTVIAGIARDGKAVIGADTAATIGGTKVYKSEGKILEVLCGDEVILIGVAGNATVTSILRGDLSIAETPDPDCTEVDADAWAHAVARGITDILVNTTPSLACNEGGEVDNIDAIMLMAWRGHLWIVHTNSVIRPSSGIAAVGSGTDVALGAMYAGVTFGAPPERAVMEAVIITARHADGCGIDERGPMVYTTEAV